jgi:GMP synthase-like glutamine amidotransferase
LGNKENEEQMTLQKKKKLKLALLNMYEGHANQGMRAIHEILNRYLDRIEFQEFDVRSKHEIPGIEFDMYISSGGPGNPLEGDGIWEKNWQNLVDALWDHNQNTKIPHKRKHMFFICHSFQMVCHHFNLGEITKRVVTSFGVYPCHKTKAGKDDCLLQGLDDPYYVVDSRDWQLVQPRLKVFGDRGATILSLEKLRTHLEYERAIMAVRFSDEFVGTQFHPEADPYGMKRHFEIPANKEIVLKNYSVRKYNDMMRNLEAPDHIIKTHSTIIPSFIDNAIAKLAKPIKQPI